MSGKTTATAPPPQQEAAKAAAKKGAAGEGTSVAATVAKGKSQALVAAGTLGFTGICLGFAFYLRNPVSFDSNKQKEEPAPSEVAGGEPLDGALSPGELLSMGEAALEEKDTARANQLLDEARVRADRDDVGIQVEVFRALARAADMEGRTKVAELHREFVSRLQLRLGPSLPLFSEAEHHLRAGETREARRLYSRFLLRSQEIDEASATYLTQAWDRLAEVMETEFKKTTPETALSIEPEGYFR